MRTPCHPAITFCFTFLVAATGNAEPIPTLFNTGIDDTGNLIATSDTVDPHYSLTQSDDPDSPGPDAVTLNPGFPVGPWIDEGPDSRWIAPRAAQNIGSAPGSYIYETKFDLTGFDISTAEITGRWLTDNSGFDIYINGESAFAASGGFTEWADFEILEGFVEGINTLEFEVSNAGDTVNPTGLRVEIAGTADLLADAPPTIVVEPKSTRALLGASVTLTVSAGGRAPFTYQWQRNGEDLPDTNDRDLTLTDLTLDDEGDYTVVVTNDFGSATSEDATLRIFSPIPGLFPTGTDAEGETLEDFAVDPHYALTVNPDSESNESIVHDSLVFPIVDGPWLANSEQSKWIAPLADTASAAGGDYTYRLTFDLTGLNPSTAFITGRWASDNAGLGLFLNGSNLGITNTTGFGSLSPFTIENAPFVSGMNTLDFVINNAGSGPTALRVETLSGGARASESQDTAPVFVRQPAGAIAIVGERVVLSALADGSPAPTYEWQLGETVVGSGPELVLDNIQKSQGGEYVVVVTNAIGSATSNDVLVNVLDPIPGIFNTGVDDSGEALDDFEVDRHYVLEENPDSDSTEALVLDSLAFPIVAGPWVANTESSKWIGAREDNNGFAGDYTYRLTFDLTSFELSTVFIEGAWATDNLGVDLILNGESTGLRNDAQFTALTSFRIEDGFVDGENTLDFIVNNADPDDNPTGLKVANLRGGGKSTGMPPEETIPELTVFVLAGNTFVLSWPAPSTGWVPMRSTNLLDWVAVEEPIVDDDDERLVAVVVADDAYFRLEKP